MPGSDRPGPAAYTACSYLTPREDFCTFELAPEFGRVLGGSIRRALESIWMAP